MSEEEERKQGFKVNDRRRFDLEGHERDGDQPPASSNEVPARDPDTSSEAPDEEITFSAFVMSLATQALFQLGQMKPPEGVAISVDPVAAKHTIDILSLLETKTKGNLDKEEEYMLREILHSLRMAFVQTSKR